MFYRARLKKLSLLKDHILFEYVNNLLFAVSTYFNLGGFGITRLEISDYIIVHKI